MSAEQIATLDYDVYVNHKNEEILFNANTTYYGMSGINIVDYGNDGDKDILFTNGDVLDGDFPSNEN